MSFNWNRKWTSTASSGKQRTRRSRARRKGDFLQLAVEVLESRRLLTADALSFRLALLAETTSAAEANEAYYWFDKEKVSLVSQPGKLSVRLAVAEKLGPWPSSPGDDGPHAWALEGMLSAEVGVLRGRDAADYEGGYLGGYGWNFDWSSPVFVDPQSGLRQVLTDEIVVALEDGADAEQFFASPTFSSYEPMWGTTNQFLATVADATWRHVLAVANAAHTQSGVEWAAPNFLAELKFHDLPNDPLIGDQWHLHNTGQTGGTTDADADLREAWDITTGSSEIVVAVLDNGVQIDHPDLNIYVNEADPDDGLDNDGNGYVDDHHGWNFVNNSEDAGPEVPCDNHGTPVAGVAAARGNNQVGVSGSTQRVRILPLKIATDTQCNLGGFASNSRLASAVRYAGRYADILVNSWGAPGSSSILESAFDDVAKTGRGGLGSVSFAATGNGATGFFSYSINTTGLPAGDWEAEFRYAKDPDGTDGDDTVWIEKVILPDADRTPVRFSDDTFPTGWNASPAGGTAWTLVNPRADDPDRLTGVDGYVARAGAIGSNQSTLLRSQSFALAAGQTLTISAWVSSEKGTEAGVSEPPDGDDGDWFSVRLCFAGTTTCTDYVNLDAGIPGSAREAGRKTIQTSVNQPASFGSTIAIGASTDFDVRAPYSQYGTELSVVAPSSGGFGWVTTTDRTGTNGDDEASDYTSTFSGTSSATPLAAGIGALMLTVNPNLTAGEVGKILAETADLIGDVSYQDGRNDFYGGGRVNAFNAVSAAQLGWADAGLDSGSLVSEEVGNSIAIDPKDTDDSDDQDTLLVAITSGDAEPKLFLTKKNLLNGAGVWAAGPIVIGGSGQQVQVTSVAADAVDGIYISGFFQGANVDFDPRAVSANDTHSANGTDTFLLKLDSAGDFQWVRTFGGGGDDRGLGLAVDGSVYLAGMFSGASVDFDPTATTAGDTLSAVGSDAFVAKYDSNGQFQWAKQAGGTATDRATAVAVDSGGNVYVGGDFEGIATLFDGATQLTSVGSQDLFLSKLNSGGVLQWTRQVGAAGAAEEELTAITTQDDSAVVALGNFEGTGFVASGGASWTSNGQTDAFVTRWNTDGTHAWSRQLGGSGEDVGLGLVIDSNNNVLVTGGFDSADFDAGNARTKLTKHRASDVFVSRFTSGGEFDWVKQLEGAGEAQASGIAVDLVDNIYLTGQFSSSLTIATASDKTTLVSESGHDPFVARVLRNRLDVQIDLNQVNENAGRNAAHARIVRYGDLSDDLVVTLKNSDTSEIDVLSQITIPAGNRLIEVPLDTVNDGDVEATAQTVTITASAFGYDSSSDNIDVTDDDTISTRTLGGPLSGTLAAATYEVIQPLSVAGGNTLTIAAGSRLNFDPAIGFHVEGTLLAEGVDGNEIVFTSSESPSTKAEDHWKGILITGNDGPRTMLDHVEISYARDGLRIWPAGRAEPIRGSEGSASHPHVTVQNSEIHHNLSNGIDVQTEGNETISSTDVQILGNQVHDNTNGIRIAAQLLVKTEIRENNVLYITESSGHSRNDATVLGNTIYANSHTGVVIEVINNTVEGIPAAGVPHKFSRVGGEIGGNVVRDNQVGIHARVESESPSARGGGPALLTSALRNNLVTRNDSSAILLEATADSAGQPSLAAAVVNNTIADNGNYGIHHAANIATGFSLRNNIVVANRIGIDAGASTTGAATTHNDVQGNSDADFGTNYPANFESQNNNLSVAPLFVDQANGDYHLQAGSPVIDQGTATGAPAGDIDGQPRFGNIDMGYDEVTASTLNLTATLTDNDTPQDGVISEAAGTAAATLRLQIAQALPVDLLVLLTSSDRGELSVPQTAVLTAGNTTVDVDVDAVNDGEIDGTSQVTLTATPYWFAPAQDSLQVTDDDTTALRTVGGPLFGQLPSAIYEVVSTIAVPEGTVLTIDPEATLRFASGTRLDVNGSLIADGELGHEIVFTSAATTPVRGDWAGVLFAKEGPAQSILNHVEISYATTGVNIDPAGSIPKLRLSDSQIHDNSTNGVEIRTNSGERITSGDVQIHHNRIHDNPSAGIFAISQHFSSSFSTAFSNISAPMTDNEIWNNTDGIRLLASTRNSDATPPGASVSSAISGNWIHDNNVGVHASAVRSRPFGISFPGPATMSVRLTNNVIESNTSHGVFLDNSDTGSAPCQFCDAPLQASLAATVVNNTIVGNDNWGIFHDKDVSSGFAIRNNLVTGNGGGVNADASYSPEAGAVSNNDVFGSSGVDWGQSYPIDYGTTENNQSIDPQYIALGDFHIQPMSALLDAGSATSAPGTDFDKQPRPVLPDIGADEVPVIDDGSQGFAEVSGIWTVVANEGLTSDQRTATAFGAEATWSFSGLTAGDYRVSATWSPLSNAATNAPFKVFDGTTLLGTATANQQRDPVGTTAYGTKWQSLGDVYTISGNTLKVSLSRTGANGKVIADAIRVERVLRPPRLQTSDDSGGQVTSGSSVAMTSTTDTAQTKTFTITNQGDQPLLLDDNILIDGVGFGLVSDFTQTTLAPGDSTEFTVELLASTSGTYAAQVTLTSNDDNESRFEFGITGTVNALPLIHTLSPTDNATGVAVDVNLVVTFDQDVQKGAGSILLRKFADDSIVQTIDVTSANVAVSGAVATIDLPADLASSTSYYVEITAGAFEDLGGDDFAGLSGNAAWNFTTAAAPPSYQFAVATSSSQVAVFTVGASILTETRSVSPTSDLAMLTNGVVKGNSYRVDQTESGGYQTYANYPTTVSFFNAAGGSLGQETTSINSPYYALDAAATDDGGFVLIRTNSNDNDDDLYSYSSSGTLRATTLDVSGTLSGITSLQDGSIAVLNSPGFGTAWIRTYDPLTLAQTGSFDYSSIPSDMGEFDIAGLKNGGVAVFGKRGSEYYVYAWYAPSDTTPTEIKLSDHGITASGFRIAGDVFSGDTIEPTVTINRQAPTSNPTNADSVTFLVDFNEDVQNVNEADFVLDLGGTVSTAALTVGDNGDSDASTYTITIPSVAGDGSLDLSFAVGQDIQDLANNAFNPSTGITSEQTYTIDNDMPSVSTLTPADDATAVAPNANLVITFNENTQKAAGNVVIKRSADDSVVQTIDVTSSDVIVSGTVATINPPVNLDENTGFYAEVAAGAFEDLAGNAFAGISGSSAWNFTTDSVPPTISTLSPADDSTNVASDANLVITFDKTVAKGAGNVLIKRSSDNSTFATIDVASAAVTISGTEVTIDPPSDLESLTAYYVQIPAGAIEDSAGTDFGGITDTTTWDFSTALGTPVMDAEPVKTPGTSNTVSWSPVAGADEYYVEYDTSSEFPSPDGNSGWITGTSHTFTGLTDGESYYYRVQARKVTTGATNSWTQTTQAEFESGTLSDTSTTAAGQVVLAGGAGGAQDIFVYGSIAVNQGFLDDMTNQGHTVTRSDVFPATPSNYDVIIVTGGGVLSVDPISSAILDAFTQAGGGLIIFEDAIQDATVSSSAASNPVSSSSGWIQRTNTTVVDSTSPLASGLSTSSSLTGYSLVPTLKSGANTVIRWNTDTVPMTVTYANGSGNVVFFNDFWAWYSTKNWDGDHSYGAQLLSNALSYVGVSGFSTSGSVTSPSITPSPFEQWTTLEFMKTTPAGTTLTVDVLNSSGGLLASNVSSGANLNSLGVTDTTIKLRANLSTTDTSVTPTLSDWTVSYQATPDTYIVSGDSNAVSSQQDATPPTVTDVILGSSSWTDPGFIDAVDGGGTGTGNGLGVSLVGSHQLDTLPWFDLDTIYIRFSEDVSASWGLGDAVLTGTNGGTYSLGTVAYGVAGTNVATIPVIGGIGVDSLVLSISDSGGVEDQAGNDLDGEWTTGQANASGNGSPGGQFNFFFNVLPGDADGSGQVTTTDVFFIFASNTAATTETLARKDVNGSGQITTTDVFAAFGNNTFGLPAAPPPPVLVAPDSPSGSASSTIDDYSADVDRLMTLSDEDERDFWYQ